MSARRCPKCGLFSPDTAIRCDCGWDFAAGVQRRASTAPAPSEAPVAITTVRIVDLDVPFGTMVRLLFKWSCAAVPVALAFVLIGYLIGLAYTHLVAPTSTLLPGR